jgi:CheY-like chemotaxis protein
VPKTLLAVDDSVTMRKVLEITFAGEDFRVIGAEGPSSALVGLAEEPVVAVIDASLGGHDGYALAKELRARAGGLAVVLMASRYAPYDANRGRDAGVDDFIDKPFDTQALIDKVKRVLVARETSRAAPPAAAAAPVQPAAPAFGATAPRPQPAPVPGAVAPPKPAWSTQRAHTLSFETASSPGPAAPVAGPSSLSRTAPSGIPFTARQAVGAQPPAPPPPPVQAQTVAPTVGPTIVPVHSGATSQPTGTALHVGDAVTTVNGRLAGKLDEIGLTRQQAEAVLALSRELVERAVWEVVPQLAETLIKEEIARIMKEG